MRFQSVGLTQAVQFLTSQAWTIKKIEKCKKTSEKHNTRHSIIVFRTCTSGHLIAQFSKTYKGTRDQVCQRIAVLAPFYQNRFLS